MGILFSISLLLKHQHIIMRVLLALALFVVVASAAVPQSTCEQKNEILKKAVLKLAKKTRTDCDACYNDILAAATECILSFDWKNCIEDVLGGGSDCIEYVCEVNADIGQIFGQDWSC